MAALAVEGLLPFRILQEQRQLSEGPSAAPETEPEPEDAVVFVGICLVLGIASRHLLRGTRVPYTVALLVLGIALGSLGPMLSLCSPFPCLVLT